MAAARARSAAETPAEPPITRVRSRASSRQPSRLRRELLTRPHRPAHVEENHRTARGNRREQVFPFGVALQLFAAGAPSLAHFAFVNLDEAPETTDVVVAEIAKRGAELTDSNQRELHYA